MLLHLICFKYKPQVDDRAALDAYQIDARHVPVAQLGVALSAHIVAVDFEI